MANERLEGRNGDIWRMYCSGRNQAYIAEHFGLSQPRVSEILTAVRGALDDTEREDWRHRAVETLLEVRAGLVRRIHADPPPAFAAGEILKDENGRVVRDYSGINSAIHLLAKLDERMARTLGTDAPVQVESASELRVTVEGVDLEALK